MGYGGADGTRTRPVRFYPLEFAAFPLNQVCVRCVCGTLIVVNESRCDPGEGTEPLPRDQSEFAIQPPAISRHGSSGVK
jgi:hypothetical protein